MRPTDASRRAVSSLILILSSIVFQIFKEAIQLFPAPMLEKFTDHGFTYADNEQQSRHKRDDDDKAAHLGPLRLCGLFRTRLGFWLGSMLRRGFCHNINGALEARPTV